MPNNDERREVAARLRVLASHVPADAEMVLDALDLHEGEYIDGFDPRCVERLADLIEPEERTCRNACEGREFQCSKCGTQWHLLTREDALCEWEHVRTPTFCPSCGAKAVGE